MLGPGRRYPIVACGVAVRTGLRWAYPMVACGVAVRTGLRWAYPMVACGFSAATNWYPVTSSARITMTSSISPATQGWSASR